jgi:hypothetical protein
MRLPCRNATWTKQNILRFHKTSPSACCGVVGGKNAETRSPGFSRVVAWKPGMGLRLVPQRKMVGAQTPLFMVTKTVWDPAIASKSPAMSFIGHGVGSCAMLSVLPARNIEACFRQRRAFSPRLSIPILGRRDLVTLL